MNVRSEKGVLRKKQSDHEDAIIIRPGMRNALPRGESWIGRMPYVENNKNDSVYLTSARLKKKRKARSIFPKVNYPLQQITNA